MLTVPKETWPTCDQTPFAQTNKIQQEDIVFIPEKIPNSEQN